MSDKRTESFFLKGVIERFDGKVAIIKIDDGQQLQWPIRQLPEDCQAGTAVRLVISTAGSDIEERSRMAKAVLNEIFKNDNGGKKR